MNSELPLFFRLLPPNRPWGDYGHVLWNGLPGYLPRTPEGNIQLLRTGPFLPAITFCPGAGSLIVSTAFRDLLQAQSPLRGAFRPVVKVKIVHLDWHTWDTTLPRPPSIPKTGEPEEYILARKHSENLSRSMGDLWELVVDTGIQALRTPSMDLTQRAEIHLLARTWTGAHLFRDSVTRGCLYVSAPGRDWLEETAPDTLRYEPAKVKIE